MKQQQRMKRTLRAVFVLSAWELILMEFRYLIHLFIADVNSSDKRRYGCMIKSR